MSFAHQQLRSFVDRVCRLNDEIKTLNGDKSEVYKEAKANGFNPKVLKAAVKRFEQLRTDRHGVEEFDALFDMYMHALLGVSDDQEGDETPPAASASPAKGILKSPTRAHAREPLPPHDEDGVIIDIGIPISDDVPATGPATAPALGAEGSPLKGDAARAGLVSTSDDDASPTKSNGLSGPSSEEGADAIALDAPSSQINSETHREPSNRDLSADGEAYSAAASQGQAAHAGTGSETLASHEGDTQGEGASALSPINSLSGELTATGTDGGAHEDEVASTADSKSSDTRRSFEQDPGQALGSDPVSEVAAIAPASAAIAPVELSPPPDKAPGAPHSGEMPDIPDFLRRVA